MPTPALPLSVLREAVKAYADACEEGFRPAYSGRGHRNAIARAADALDLSHKALRCRLDLAVALGLHVENWPAPDPEWARGVHLRYLMEDEEYAAAKEPREPLKPQPFTPPYLPKTEEPIEDLIERRKAQFQRRQQATAARQWMRFTVNTDGPFGLIFVGDPHMDDDGADIVTLERHLEMIAGVNGMFGVGMGDWTNNWSGRLARLKGEQSMTDRQAWAFAEWVLKRPGWMLLLRGNHDMWSGAGDPLKWMANGSAPLLDWRAQFEVACGDAVWRIDAAHDFPGSSQWNRLHALLKAAKMSGHAADIYMAAHRHNWGIAEEQDENTGRSSWLGRCKGYKALDSYALVNGYGQAQDRGHSITAVFQPANRKVQLFADVEEAADFLAYLKRRRAA